ncbi:hypothetical protein QAD02_013730 [Eretmocerus hayati]|uniref:Uncharacterized protein n=1 Tax=Eretmocerus hayati TaxID=131215 RepID=A0ACC2P4B3_9HYME|nr:hypothetical protein QAD02_013730 [Eretmocerus hayati]
MGCVPTVIRADPGTENVIVESLQKSFRAGHDDKQAGPKSYLTGSSVYNTKIESFWGQLRRSSMDFYIQLFQGMKDKLIFNGSEDEIKLLQFCFAAVIQADLVESKDLWNRHLIRKQPTNSRNGDIPFALYNLPKKFRATDCRKPVDLAAVDRLLECEELVSKPQLFDESFSQRVYSVIPDVKMPTNHNEALNLYIVLKQLLLL